MRLVKLYSKGLRIRHVSISKSVFLELQLSTLYVGKNKPFSANKLLVPALNRKVSRGPATVYELDSKSLAMLFSFGSFDSFLAGEWYEQKSSVRCMFLSPNGI